MQPSQGPPKLEYTQADQLQAAGARDANCTIDIHRHEAHDSHVTWSREAASCHWKAGGPRRRHSERRSSQPLHSVKTFIPVPSEGEDPFQEVTQRCTAAPDVDMHASLDGRTVAIYNHNRWNEIEVAMTTTPPTS